ncbi:MAG: leucine-rich repeat domain-containing protein [Lachnospiraceae bacterium]|nr:leucine-rich repeat domain-containing protein [Lachnospiraceae bacterium]
MSDVANNAGQNLAQKLNDGIKFDVPMEDGTVKTATLRTKNGSGANQASQGATGKVLRSDGYMNVAGYKMKTMQFDYEITQQDTIRLLACVGETEENIHIPDYIGGRKVTIIGENCFAHVAAKSIYCPKTIEVIETGAFRKCAAESISLEEGLKTIGEGAFNNTIALKRMNIPNTVTSIGKGAFMACGVEYLHLSTGLTEIPADCFFMCHVRNLVVPGSVKSIGANAFANVKELRSVILQDGVEIIGDKAFANCLELREIEVPNSVVHLNLNMMEGSGNAYFKVHVDHPIWDDIRNKKVELNFIERLSVYGKEWVALDFAKWMRELTGESFERPRMDEEYRQITFMMANFQARAFRDAASDEGTMMAFAGMNMANGSILSGSAQQVAYGLNSLDGAQQQES